MNIEFIYDEFNFFVDILLDWLFDFRVNLFVEFCGWFWSSNVRELFRIVFLYLLFKVVFFIGFKLFFGKCKNYGCR